MSKRWLAFFILMSQAAMAQEATVYSETLVGSRDENVTSYSKLLLEGSAFGFAPYAGLVLQKDQRSTGTVIYNENYVAPTVGLKAPLFNGLSAFTEGRRVESETNREKNPWDFRAGFVGYWEKNLIGKLSQGLQAQSYFDLIYSSRMDSQVVGTVFSRLVYSYQPEFAPRPYVQGLIKRDSLGFFYENIQELHAGMLIRFIKTDFLSVNAYFYEKWGVYDGRNDQGGMPERRDYQETMGMLVISGGMAL